MRRDRRILRKAGMDEVAKVKSEGAGVWLRGRRTGLL